MRRSIASLVYLLAFLVLPLAPAGEARADQAPVFSHTADVIYGRKHGVALTMDVFAPKTNANGAAVIWVVSGGWFSTHDFIASGTIPTPVKELGKRGYTVFAVVHGSQPKYTIPEILEDMHRAVRYIRSHATEFKIDPDRIGITGGSAGGHLSLMQGTAGTAGDPKAKDPVDQASSRVQAVACFFPPTDFLNYGLPGDNALGRGVLKDFSAPFAFQEFRRKDGWAGTLVPITDEAKILEIGRQISPINHVSADDPPTLIIHGDQDKLVPLQQAELIVAKLKEAGVPTELVVKKGAGHGWPDIDKDYPAIADWFDKYLTDLAQLQGTWSMVSGERDGQPVPEEIVKQFKRVAKSDEITVTVGDQLFLKAKIALDSSKEPKTIDYTLLDGPNKGQKQLGIYALAGETVKFCFAPPGQDRPKDFTTAGDAGGTMSTWKREKR